MTIRTSFLVTAAAAMLAPFAVMASDAPTKDKDEAKAEKPVAECTQVTGSRIKARNAASCDRLANRPFRSYSAERLQETGEIDMADALRKLDPAFR